MKTFLTAWIAIIVFGWLLIGFAASVFGSVGLLILAAAVIAVLVAVLEAQFKEVDALSARVKALEEQIAGETEQTVHQD